MVRHAVLRAISCEVIPAKEGPLLFSSATSSVLSHAFSLRDSRARGCRRQYAILLLSKERHPLVQHWAVLQERVQDIITSLQKKAEGKYEMDCKSLAELKEKCDYVREATTTTSNKSSFSRRRASSKPARGLREVTQDEQVFEGMHQDLVTVLALAERCLKEQVLSGQPLLSSVRGSGTTPLAVVRDIMGQVPEMGCRLLLYRLLSGQSIQVLDQEYPDQPSPLPCRCRAINGSWLEPPATASVFSYRTTLLPLPPALQTSSSPGLSWSRPGLAFRWPTDHPTLSSLASWHALESQRRQ